MVGKLAAKQAKQAKQVGQERRQSRRETIDEKQLMRGN